MPPTRSAGPPGLLIAAPASGSGKTVLTLSLLRAFRRRGVRVASAKSGPDYIDPAFHSAAGGRSCVSLDSWAMHPMQIRRLVHRAATEADLFLLEGAMGLFDGAIGPVPGPRDGSCAALALQMGLPVVLVVDCRSMLASTAALIRGFVDHHPEVRIVGVILNRIGSSRHGTAIAKAVRATVPDVEILGKVPRSPDLELPARHLGLVQAGEAPDLEAFLDKAAGVVAKSVDLSRLQSLAEPLPAAQSSVQALGAALLLPPGQRVALARDEAFAFTYDGVLEDWRRDGVEISFFSPLNDEPIPKRADAVWLPGGYPELHAGRLAGAERFLRSLRAAAAHGLPVFGECGGYMLLGRGIIDADGHSHAMADLLPLETDFSPAGRRLRLGYRRARLLGDVPGLGKAGDRFNAHEFHYAGISWMGALSGTVSGGGAIAEPVFAVTDAAGIGLDPVGQRVGSVAGSFLHLIAKE